MSQPSLWNPCAKIYLFPAYDVSHPSREYFDQKKTGRPGNLQLIPKPIKGHAAVGDKLSGMPAEVAELADVGLVQPNVYVKIEYTRVIYSKPN